MAARHRFFYPEVWKFIFPHMRCAIRLLETVRRTGDEQQGVRTLTTDVPMLGAIPNPEWTGNSVIPTVATGPQSVKRDEKRVRPESDRVIPASKCLRVGRRTSVTIVMWNKPLTRTGLDQNGTG